jgi:predicted O-methyltransferase YrrM
MRLKVLGQSGYFEKPAFPVLPPFELIKTDSILREVGRYQQRFNDFQDSANNEVGYTFDNEWFSSPDTEMLYTFVRKYRPKNVIEIGSGHSTMIIRQAIMDGKLKTFLTCIDPQPRTDISRFANRFHARPVEAFAGSELFRSLSKNDILFIDSSHKIKTGNDVVFLYLNVIPYLPKGVLIHIHDIFLPYEYPKEWILDKKWFWNEQYLIQALLSSFTFFDVLWAGYYLQRTRANFAEHFDYLNGKVAKSLWLRKK